MVVIVFNLLVCFFFILGQYARVVYASEPKTATTTLISILPTESTPGRPTLSGVKPQELRISAAGSRSSGFKRYHEIEKPKFLPYAQSQMSDYGRARKALASPSEKISYEIKVYIPRPSDLPLDHAHEKPPPVEIIPVRYAPLDYFAPPHPMEETPPMPPPYAPKYEPQRTSSFLRPYYSPTGRIMYETKPVTIYSEEIAPPERRPSKPYPGDREPKPRYSDPYYQSSVDGKNGEDGTRPMTYVEVKQVKQGEPAYPPSYKPKTSRYSEVPQYDRESPYHAPDYVPYDQQQTTDPPLPVEKEVVYYEKSPPEMLMAYDYRSRSPYQGKQEYGLMANDYYQPPPPPPPQMLPYQPTYYYYYPQQYGQQQGYHQSNSYPHPHHSGGQYQKLSPRPLYSGYSYAAYAPYRK